MYNNIPFPLFLCICAGAILLPLLIGFTPSDSKSSERRTLAWILLIPYFIFVLNIVFVASCQSSNPYAGSGSCFDSGDVILTIFLPIPAIICMIFAIGIFLSTRRKKPESDDNDTSVI